MMAGSHEGKNHPHKHSRTRRGSLEKRRKSMGKDEPYKLDLNDRNGILREIRKQLDEKKQRHEVLCKENAEKIEALEEQYAKLNRFHKRHICLYDENDTEIMNQLSTIETEIEQLKKEMQPPVRSSPAEEINRVNEIFSRQKTYLKMKKKKEIKDYHRSQRNKIGGFETYQPVKHNKPWNPCTRVEQLKPEKLAFEPNIHGKDFNLKDRSIWPVIKPHQKKEEFPQPWKSVPAGEIFGEPPDKLLSKQKRRQLKQQIEEVERCAAKRELRNKKKQKEAARTHAKFVKTPWKPTISSAGFLFERMKIDRPLTYHERRRAELMTTPDRNRYDPTNDGKAPWLPTRSGELFNPITPLHEVSNDTMMDPFNYHEGTIVAWE